MKELLERVCVSDVLELAGAMCLAIFLACWWAPVAAWLVAGVALILKSFELDTRGAPPSDRPARSVRAAKQPRRPDQAPH